MGDADVYGMTLLKFILNTLDIRVMIGIIWLRIESSCEQSTLLSLLIP
jgi:hypothetical protein